MTQHIFTKQGGNFERKLSPEMIKQYFTSQNNSPNPISPLEFQAQQTGQRGTSVVDNTTPFQSSQIPQTPNYADTFNNVMLEILKKAQGVDNVELLKRKRALERASLDRASAPTPEELRTLSPSQQNTIRSGDVKVLSSEIDENAYLLSKAESQIDNFYKSFEAVSKLGAEFADKMPLPEKVLESFVTALQQRPIEDWSSILAGLSDKNKSEALAKVDYSNITEEPKGVSDQKEETKDTKQTNLQRFELEKGLRDVGIVLKDLELGESGELAKVFGRYQQFIPQKILSGNKAFLFNKLEQTKSAIVLHLRAKLKGQGTITDQEQDMLAKASTAISRNLEIDDVKSEVEEMKSFLEFQLSEIQSTGGGNDDPLGIL